VGGVFWAGPVYGEVGERVCRLEVLTPGGPRDLSDNWRRQVVAQRQHGEGNRNDLPGRSLREDRQRRDQGTGGDGRVANGCHGGCACEQDNARLPWLGLLWRGWLGRRNLLLLSLSECRIEGRPLTQQAAK